MGSELLQGLQLGIWRSFSIYSLFSATVWTVYSYVHWFWSYSYEYVNVQSKRCLLEIVREQLSYSISFSMHMISALNCCLFASPVLWFRPGPCRNTELQSSGQTSAAASFSWYSAAFSASRPLGPSPDPEESRAWRPETALQAPYSWIVLYIETQHMDKNQKKHRVKVTKAEVDEN